MNKRYTLDYQDENNYKKLERNLKNYNLDAYKKLLFDYYPKLKEGIFVGEIDSTNKKNQIATFNLKIPTDLFFSRVYGPIVLNYTIYNKEKLIKLNYLEPKDLLQKRQAELIKYKGIMISKDNAQKEMFKIDLLYRLEGIQEE